MSAAAANLATRKLLTKGRVEKKQVSVVDGKYKLGSSLGKGGFGVVYEALNVETGDFVAVKQMSIHDMKQDEVDEIMSEITLLRNLDHPNIVQYIDNVKQDGYLHIVLEYMENGSLSQIVKKFGVFSEAVAMAYIKQVLDGLAYLHAQGVIHRDIKGANILTTKDGLVKLADFGVAIKLGENDESEASVVGTPYWMAPEIIEMSGQSSACDIWSVGCVVVELLTSAPPYFDLAPMAALFRIVTDPHPPLPERVSSMLRDFLLKCFLKEPKMRGSAVKLLRHSWIRQASHPGGKVDRPARRGGTEQQAHSRRPVASSSATGAFAEEEDDEELVDPSVSTVKLSAAALGPGGIALIIEGGEGAGAGAGAGGADGSGGVGEDGDDDANEDGEDWDTEFGVETTAPAVMQLGGTGDGDDDNDNDDDDDDDANEDGEDWDAEFGVEPTGSAAMQLGGDVEQMEGLGLASAERTVGGKGGNPGANVKQQQIQGAMKALRGQSGGVGLNLSISQNSGGGSGGGGAGDLPAALAGALGDEDINDMFWDDDDDGDDDDADFDAARAARGGGAGGRGQRGASGADGAGGIAVAAPAAAARSALNRWQENAESDDDDLEGMLAGLGDGDDDTAGDDATGFGLSVGTAAGSAERGAQQRSTGGGAALASRLEQRLAMNLTAAGNSMRGGSHNRMGSGSDAFFHDGGDLLGGDSIGADDADMWEELDFCEHEDKHEEARAISDIQAAVRLLNTQDDESVIQRAADDLIQLFEVRVVYGCRCPAWCDADTRARHTRPTNATRCRMHTSHNSIQSYSSTAHTHLCPIMYFTCLLNARQYIHVATPGDPPPSIPTCVFAIIAYILYYYFF